MDVDPKQDDPRSRWEPWIPVIQATVNGAVAIILNLFGQGRHPL
jgi:hypothetical protein